MLNLRTLRDERGLSLRDLAQKLDITYSSLGKYERNEQQPNIETLIKIANYFDVTVDYLIGRTNCKNINNQPIADALGIDEQTILTLKSMSNDMYVFEPLIQHPAFKDLLGNIKQYISLDKEGWKDLLYTTTDSNKVLIEHSVPSEVVKSSMMQKLLQIAKAIVEDISSSFTI